MAELREMGDSPNHSRQAEGAFETGMDERAKNTMGTGGDTHNENQRVTYSNIKRTYDVYQDLDVQAARQQQVTTAQINQIAVQALQNAVENSNIIAKRTIELNNLAHDSFWNPVASGAGMNLTAGAVPANRAADVAAAGQAVNAEAVGAVVAKTLDATLVPLMGVLQQLVQGVASMNASMANVIAQTQPKS